MSLNNSDTNAERQPAVSSITNSPADKNTVGIEKNTSPTAKESSPAASSTAIQSSPAVKSVFPVRPLLLNRPVSHSAPPVRSSPVKIPKVSQTTVVPTVPETGLQLVSFDTASNTGSNATGSNFIPKTVTTEADLIKTLVDIKKLPGTKSTVSKNCTTKAKFNNVESNSKNSDKNRFSGIDLGSWFKNIPRNNRNLSNIYGFHTKDFYNLRPFKDHDAIFSDKNDGHDVENADSEKKQSQSDIDVVMEVQESEQVIENQAASPSSSEHAASPCSSTSQAASPVSLICAGQASPVSSASSYGGQASPSSSYAGNASPSSAVSPNSASPNSCSPNSFHSSASGDQSNPLYPQEAEHEGNPFLNNDAPVSIDTVEKKKNSKSKPVLSKSDSDKKEVASNSEKNPFANPDAVNSNKDDDSNCNYLIGYVTQWDPERRVGKLSLKPDINQHNHSVAENDIDTIRFSLPSTNHNIELSKKFCTGATVMFDRVAYSNSSGRPKAVGVRLIDKCTITDQEEIEEKVMEVKIREEMIRESNPQINSESDTGRVSDDDISSESSESENQVLPMNSSNEDVKKSITKKLHLKDKIRVRQTEIARLSILQQQSKKNLEELVVDKEQQQLRLEYDKELKLKEEKDRKDKKILQKTAKEYAEMNKILKIHEVGSVVKNIEDMVKSQEQEFSKYSEEIKFLKEEILKKDEYIKELEIRANDAIKKESLVAEENYILRRKLKNYISITNATNGEENQCDKSSVPTKLPLLDQGIKEAEEVEKSLEVHKLEVQKQKALDVFRENALGVKCEVNDDWINRAKSLMSMMEKVIVEKIQKSNDGKPLIYTDIDVDNRKFEWCPVTADIELQKFNHYLDEYAKGYGKLYYGEKHSEPGAIADNDDFFNLNREDLELLQEAQLLYEEAEQKEAKALEIEESCSHREQNIEMMKEEIRLREEELKEREDNFNEKEEVQKVKKMEEELKIMEEKVIASEKEVVAAKNLSERRCEAAKIEILNGRNHVMELVESIKKREDDCKKRDEECEKKIQSAEKKEIEAINIIENGALASGELKKLVENRVTLPQEKGKLENIINFGRKECEKKIEKNNRECEVKIQKMKIECKEFKMKFIREFITGLWKIANSKGNDTNTNATMSSMSTLCKFAGLNGVPITDTNIMKDISRDKTTLAPSPGPQGPGTISKARSISGGRTLAISDTAANPDENYVIDENLKSFCVAKLAFANAKTTSREKSLDVNQKTLELFSLDSQEISKEGGPKNNSNKFRSKSKKRIRAVSVDTNILEKLKKETVTVEENIKRQKPESIAHVATDYQDAIFKSFMQRFFKEFNIGDETKSLREINTKSMEPPVGVIDPVTDMITNVDTPSSSLPVKTVATSQDIDSPKNIDYLVSQHEKLALDFTRIVRDCDEDAENEAKGMEEWMKVRDDKLKLIKKQDEEILQLKRDILDLRKKLDLPIPVEFFGVDQDEKKEIEIPERFRKWKKGYRILPKLWPNEIRKRANSWEPGFSNQSNPASHTSSQIQPLPLKTKKLKDNIAVDTTISKSLEKSALASLHLQLAEFKRSEPKKLADEWKAGWAAAKNVFLRKAEAARGHPDMHPRNRGEQYRDQCFFRILWSGFEEVESKIVDTRSKIAVMQLEEREKKENVERGRSLKAVEGIFKVDYYKEYEKYQKKFKEKIKVESDDIGVPEILKVSRKKKKKDKTCSRGKDVEMKDTIPEEKSDTEEPKQSTESTIYDRMDDDGPLAALNYVKTRSWYKGIEKRTAELRRKNRKQQDADILALVQRGRCSRSRMYEKKIIDKTAVEPNLANDDDDEETKSTEDPEIKKFNQDLVVHEVLNKKWKKRVEEKRESTRVEKDEAVRKRSKSVRFAEGLKEEVDTKGDRKLDDELNTIPDFIQTPALLLKSAAKPKTNPLLLKSTPKSGNLFSEECRKKALIEAKEIEKKEEEEVRRKEGEYKKWMEVPLKLPKEMMKKYTEEIDRKINPPERKPSKGRKRSLSQRQIDNPDNPRQIKKFQPQYNIKRSKSDTATVSKRLSKTVPKLILTSKDEAILSAAASTKVSINDVVRDKRGLSVPSGSRTHPWLIKNNDNAPMKMDKPPSVEKEGTAPKIKQTTSDNGNRDSLCNTLKFDETQPSATAFRSNCAADLGNCGSSTVTAKRKKKACKPREVLLTPVESDSETIFHNPAALKTDAGTKSPDSPPLRSFAEPYPLHVSESNIRLYEKLCGPELYKYPPPPAFFLPTSPVRGIDENLEEEELHPLLTIKPIKKHIEEENTEENSEVEENRNAILYGDDDEDGIVQVTGRDLLRNLGKKEAKYMLDTAGRKNKENLISHKKELERLKNKHEAVMNGEEYYEEELHSDAKENVFQRKYKNCSIDWVPRHTTAKLWNKFPQNRETLPSSASDEEDGFEPQCYDGMSYEERMEQKLGCIEGEIGKTKWLHEKEFDRNMKENCTEEKEKKLMREQERKLRIVAMARKVVEKQEMKKIYSNGEELGWSDIINVVPELPRVSDSNSSGSSKLVKPMTQDLFLKALGKEAAGESTIINSNSTMAVAPITVNIVSTENPIPSDNSREVITTANGTTRIINKRNEDYLNRSITAKMYNSDLDVGDANLTRMNEEMWEVEEGRMESRKELENFRKEAKEERKRIRAVNELELKLKETMKEKRATELKETEQQLKDIEVKYAEAVRAKDQISVSSSKKNKRMKKIKSITLQQKINSLEKQYQVLQKRIKELKLEIIQEELEESKQERDEQVGGNKLYTLYKKFNNMNSISEQEKLEENRILLEWWRDWCDEVENFGRGKYYFGEENKKWFLAGNGPNGGKIPEVITRYEEYMDNHTMLKQGFPTRSRLREAKQRAISYALFESGEAKEESRKKAISIVKEEETKWKEEFVKKLEKKIEFERAQKNGTETGNTMKEKDASTKPKSISKVGKKIKTLLRKLKVRKSVKSVKDGSKKSSLYWEQDMEIGDPSAKDTLKQAANENIKTSVPATDGIKLFSNNTTNSKLSKVSVPNPILTTHPISQSLKLCFTDNTNKLFPSSSAQTEKQLFNEFKTHTSVHNQDDNLSKPIVSSSKPLKKQSLAIFSSEYCDNSHTSPFHETGAGNIEKIKLKDCSSEVSKLNTKLKEFSSSCIDSTNRNPFLVDSNSANLDSNLNDNQDEPQLNEYCSSAGSDSESSKHNRVSSEGKQNIGGSILTASQAKRNRRKRGPFFRQRGKRGSGKYKKKLVLNHKGPEDTVPDKMAEDFCEPDIAVSDWEVGEWMRSSVGSVSGQNSGYANSGASAYSSLNLNAGVHGTIQSTLDKANAERNGKPSQALTGRQLLRNSGKGNGGASGSRSNPLDTSGGKISGRGWEADNDSFGNNRDSGSRAGDTWTSSFYGLDSARSVASWEEGGNRGNVNDNDNDDENIESWEEIEDKARATDKNEIQDSPMDGEWDSRSIGGEGFSNPFLPNNRRSRNDDDIESEYNDCISLAAGSAFGPNFGRNESPKRRRIDDGNMGGNMIIDEDGNQIDLDPWGTDPAVEAADFADQQQEMQYKAMQDVANKGRGQEMMQQKGIVKGGKMMGKKGKKGLGGKMDMKGMMPMMPGMMMPMMMPGKQGNMMPMMMPMVGTQGNMMMAGNSNLNPQLNSQPDKAKGKGKYSLGNTGIVSNVVQPKQQQVEPQKFSTTAPGTRPPQPSGGTEKDGVDETRPTAYITEYDPLKGTGFVTSDALWEKFRKPIFFHINDFADPEEILEVGDWLYYTHLAKNKHKKPQLVGVAPCNSRGKMQDPNPDSKRGRQATNPNSDNPAPFGKNLTIFFGSIPYYWTPSDVLDWFKSKCCEKGGGDREISFFRLGMKEDGSGNMGSGYIGFTEEEAYRKCLALSGQKIGANDARAIFVEKSRVGIPLKKASEL